MNNGHQRLDDDPLLRIADVAVHGRGTCLCQYGAATCAKAPQKAADHNPGEAFHMSPPTTFGTCGRERRSWKNLTARIPISRVKFSTPREARQEDSGVSRGGASRLCMPAGPRRSLARKLDCLNSSQLSQVFSPRGSAARRYCSSEAELPAPHAGRSEAEPR
jgi:hypothetical protein